MELVFCIRLISICQAREEPLIAYKWAWQEIIGLDIEGTELFSVGYLSSDWGFGPVRWDGVKLELPF